MNWRRYERYFFIITFATGIVAAAVFFFLVPSHLSVGSISGLSIILNNFIPIPISMITLIIDVLLLVVSFFLIGKDFGIKTVYTSILLPLFQRLFEVLLPDYKGIMGDPFLDMVMFCVVVSVGLAMLFVRNASSGGIDIIGKIMNKFLRIEFGRAVSIAGMVVAALSLFFYDVKTALLSALGTYFMGLVVDHFIFGFEKKRRVCIISQKLDQIRDFIINEMHSGATLYEATGAYNMEKHQEIVVIVDKQEYQRLRSYIEAVDPGAFITVYEVSTMSYTPKPGAKKA